MPTTTPFPPSWFLTSGALYFDESASASVAATLLGQVVLSFRVPDRRVAIVLDVGIDAGQLTGWWNGQFYLELNGVRDPAFTLIRGMISRFVDPVPCYRIAKPGTLVRVLVDNLSATFSSQYAARVRGFYVDENTALEWDAPNDLRG